MTREEAIRLIGWLKCTTNREDDLEAIDMAIEALDTQDLYLKALERMIEFHRTFTRLLDEKTEQTEATCETCKYNCFSWDEEVCESCTMGGEDNHWERKEKEENVLSNDTDNSDSKSNGFHDDVNEIDRPIIPNGEVRFIGCHFGQGGGDNIKTAKANENIVSLVRCKDCRWYRDTFLDTKITPTCDRHIDDRYGTLVGGITGESFCSYGERREP